MRTSVIAGLAAALVATVAWAQSGYNEAARKGRDPNADLSTPALGDIMLTIQFRHIKVWYAARSESWALADYEVGHLLDSLARAALLYSNIPIEQVKAGMEPLTGMQAAIKARDLQLFTQRYGELTAACNACHQAGDVAFIRIQTPSGSPFSDQVYPVRP